MVPFLQVFVAELYFTAGKAEVLGRTIRTVHVLVDTDLLDLVITVELSLFLILVRRTLGLFASAVLLVGLGGLVLLEEHHLLLL